MGTMSTGTPTPVGGVEHNQITAEPRGSTSWVRAFSCASSSTLATGAGNGRAGSPFNAPGALAAMPAVSGATFVPRRR